MDLRFFEIYRNPDYLWRLAEGLWFSLSLTITAAVFGMVLATGLALARHARTPILSHLAAGYVEFTRNTPLIVQLFFIAFGLPLLFGYVWPFWAHALLALTLNFAAYFAEILRAGFASVDEGQTEAAAALGLSKRLIFRKIVLPQALAMMYPALGAQFIFLFLTTGVISEIGVEDLTHAGLFIDSRTFRSFEVFITLTALYILSSLTLKAALAMIERRAFAWKTAR